MMPKIKLFGKVLQHLQTYKVGKEIGFEYIFNPKTNKIHKFNLSTFWDNHNFSINDVAGFIGLTNMLSISMHCLRNNNKIPIYDFETAEIIGSYYLKKCKYCFTS